MIRAGFITPGLYWGGAERWLHDLALYTKDRIAWVGCAVVTQSFCDDTMKQKVGKLMPVWGFGRTAVQYVSAPADVMIAWGTNHLKELIDGYNRPLVYVAHGAGEFDKNSSKTSVDGATHLAAVSRASLRAFKDPSRVTILHNGIDSTRCAITRSRDEVRRELGLTENEYAVGYLGRLAPEKNPTIIGEALAFLPKKFRGVWIGEGWDAEQQQAIIRSTIGSRAIFHERVEDIGNYLQAFDCFVLASPSEGFSMAMLEAMYTGVPIVTTPVGAIPELREKHGQLWEEVPIGCTGRQLARAIEAVATAPAVTMKKRIALARAAVEESYLGQHMADRWVAYLEKIVGSG